VERVKRENELMYFVYVYENRTMKPIEDVLRRGGECKRMVEGMNLIKIHCKHICKCYNESLYCTTNIF
jgi:trehalose utilization protein